MREIQRWPAMLIYKKLPRKTCFSLTHYNFIQIKPMIDFNGIPLSGKLVKKTRQIVFDEIINSDVFWNTVVALKLLACWICLSHLHLWHWTWIPENNPVSSPDVDAPWIRTTTYVYNATSDDKVGIIITLSFSMMTSSNGNIFRFDVFSDLRLTKRLRKQS